MKTSSKLLINLLLCSIFLLPFSAIFAQNENKDAETKASGSSSTEYFKGGMKVEKLGNDSVIIHIKKHDFDNFSMKGCPLMHKRGKYNGHWAGIDLGWNGYVNKDFNMTFPANEQYLNLNSSRSMTVNLNPIEFNLNLVKNHFGLTSGLGFSLNNYYFSNSYTLIPDSMSLVAFKVVDQFGNTAAMRVNKLFVSWITVPVIFEFQTNPKISLNSFHISVGVIGGIRLQTYTKQEFKNDNDMTYYLQDQSGKTVASMYVDERFVRKHSQFHLNPFKLDATMRIGWSFLNFWTTYSITPMYQKDQGPELYPWTVGITLLGW
jgi:hypothetical protein